MAKKFATKLSRSRVEAVLLVQMAVACGKYDRLSLENIFRNTLNQRFTCGGGFCVNSYKDSIAFRNKEEAIRSFTYQNKKSH